MPLPNTNPMHGPTPPSQNPRGSFLKPSGSNTPINKPGLSTPKPKEPTGPKDTSIFAGRSEISRIKFKHELMKDPKVYQASRQTGLNMNSIERAKLVKENFSKAYGRSISKTDIKQSVRELGRKMFNEKDPKEHSKLRKEIKFFKKIGGI